jgi:hypothetical protein
MSSPTRHAIPNGPAWKDRVQDQIETTVELSGANDKYADNKGFAEDLTEGKFSFPVVHGVRSDTSNRQLLRK